MPCIKAIGQLQSKCSDERLEVYADSIRILITHFKPEMAIQLSDSLLQAHSTLVCPDLVRIKAWKAYAYEHLFNFEAAIEIHNNILKTAEKLSSQEKKL